VLFALRRQFLGRRRHLDGARGRPGKWGRLRRVGLEEAPTGLLVEGEGAADLVVRAGRRARAEIGVLDRLVIEARKVRTLQQRYRAVGRPGARQAAGNDKKCRDKWHGP